MVTADALLRAAFAQARGDLDGRRILVIGDDGLQTLSLALAGRPERVVMLDIDERLAAFVRDVAGREGLPVEACAYDVRTPLPARFAGGFDVVVCDPLETVAGLRLFLARAAAALCGAGTAIIFGLTTLEACAAKWHAVQGLLHDMGFFITDARRRFHGYPGHDGPPDDPRFNVPFLEALGQTGAEAAWYRSALVRAEAVRSPDPCVVDPVRPDLEVCADGEAWATPRAAPERGATPDRSALTFPAPDLAADALERCVAAALERQAPPSLAALVRPARLFDEGWDFRVLARGGEWVVRGPRAAESRPLLHRERALLDVVRAAVDAGVAIPEVAFIGEPAEGLPGGFTVCRRVPGAAAWRVPAERLDRPAVARQLARFLTALHGVPLSRIAAFGIPVDPDMVSLAANGARVARIVAPAQLDQALEAAGLPGAARRRCAEILAEPDRWRAAGKVSPRRIHSDFEVDHILLDPDGACVRRVIDWTDSVLGDPAADLAGLWVWGGSPLVDAVLADHGGAPADPGLRDRVRGYGG